MINLSKTKLEVILFASAVLCASIGALVIAGWHIHSLTLLKVFPNFEPMRYNAALGFLITGAGLLALTIYRYRVLTGCGLAVGLLGIITLLQYVIGVDFGIDQLFIKDTVSASYPGRMALSTSLAFVFTGAALFPLGIRTWQPRLFTAGLLGSIIISFAVTALIGYLIGTSSINAWGDFIAMAVHTAAAFAAVGAGVVAAAWREELTEERDASRWLSILVISVGVMTGALILWRMSVALERDDIERTVRHKINQINYDIQTQTESRINALVRMARRWEIQGKPLRKDWEADARLYLDHLMGVQSIAWLDPSLSVRWSVKAPGFKEFASDERSKARRLSAIDRKTAVITKPVGLEGGGKGFLAYIPIYRGHSFEGFIVGIFAVQELFDPILLHEVGSGYYVDISSGSEKIYERYGSDIKELDRWAQEADVEVYGATWRVRVWPNNDILSEIQSPLPEVILAAGIAMSSLIGLLVYFAQKSHNRAKTAEKANSDLEIEITERKRAEEEAEWHAMELERSNKVLEREIAERRKAEEQSERHAEELKRSNAELEQFAYVASHDLQEPLRVIAGYVQLLSRRYKGKLDSNADEFIAFAVSGATRMQTLINDLLTYSRVGSKGREFKPSDCKAIFEGALVNLRQAIEETSALITHGDLPCVLGDASQLGQLFQNLISNALKYRSEKAPRVHVCAVRKNGAWLFSVNDNGIGIDPKYHDRIFIIFQRLHGKNEYSGTGIGLAICKKIVERHGGQIWVESNSGAGSTFYFTLPNKRSET